jgi:hypothetical protein
VAFWFLNNQNDSSAPEHLFFYGLPTDTPVVGDWNNDGCDTIGVWRLGLWFLNDQLDSSFPEYVFGFGLFTDRPVVGPWQ